MLAAPTTEAGKATPGAVPVPLPRAHAFDPYAQPDLFRGVLMRRVVAFLIDLVVLSILIVLAVGLHSPCSGVVTLGLGWALFWLISPATVIWPVVYYGMSLGGPHLGHRWACE